MGQWRQLLAFGDGRLAPKGSLFTTITERSLDQYKRKGQEKHPYRCLAMKNKANASQDANMTGFVEILTVPCNMDPENSNEQIVEWIFVPFILDESENLIPLPPVSTASDQVGAADDGSCSAAGDSTESLA